MMSNQELLDHEMGSPPSVVDVEKVIRRERRRVRYQRVGAAGVLAAAGVAFALVLSTLPRTGATTDASAGGTPEATAGESSNLVTKSDADALLGGFLIPCEDPATYSLAGQGVPCAKLKRGRIYDVDGHYCADDWHVVSSQIVGTKADLEKYEPQQSIDGVMLPATRTPIRLIDPIYSQQQYGGQYYYIQVGVVLSPQQISPGKHSLRQFATFFDRQIPFTIDLSGTGVCAGSGGISALTPSAGR